MPLSKTPAKLAALAVHAILLVAALSVASPRFTFFSVLSTIAQNNFLHLLHTSLVIHVLFACSFSLAASTMGELTASERSEYNERVYAMVSELLMVISLFPSDFEMLSVLHFSFLYAVKSLSWTYSIRAQRMATHRLLLGGAIGAALTGIAAANCWLYSHMRLSISVLFALEYSLTALGIFRTTVLLIIEIYGAEKSRSWNSFMVSIIYYSLKAASLLGFVVVVTVHHRFPVNSARSLVYTLNKLYKKINLFRAYLQLCRDLESIEEVEINGTCAICTEDLATGKMLPCKHAFHASCLKLWCEHEQNCPICRSNLVTRAEKRVITGSEVLTGVPIDEESPSQTG